MKTKHVFIRAAIPYPAMDQKLYEVESAKHGQFLVAVLTELGPYYTGVDSVDAVEVEVSNDGAVLDLEALVEISGVRPAVSKPALHSALRTAWGVCTLEKRVLPAPPKSSGAPAEDEPGSPANAGDAQGPGEEDGRVP